MAEEKPLRLKAQRVASKVVIAKSSPIAQVCVDTGVYHLQDIYDYVIPENISGLVVPGVLVKVPFGKSEVLGYVVSRLAGEMQVSKLKPISKIISPIALLSEELIAIIGDTCERYACKPWDLVKSAIPPRAASVERAFVERAPLAVIEKELKLQHQLLIVSNVGELQDEINNLLKSLTGKEQLLVIVPDERDIAQLQVSALAVNPLVLSSNLDKSQRYENYLRARFDYPKLIVGNRSAIFTPLAPNSKILIFNDGDESMYERRFPGWNVRDVALLRSGDFSLIFASASPSLEVARLTALGWIKNRTRTRADKTKRNFVFADSRDSDIAIIKKGLKEGHVLVVMAESGYVNAIACQKCRNQARCDCGGKLCITEKNRAPICYLCEEVYKNWRCRWCDSDIIRAISRGSSRYVEEISKAVPGTRVLLSKGNARTDVLPNLTENVLVVATYGCEPLGEYSAVIFRSLENLTNRIDLRSLESVRRLILEDIGKISRVKGGYVYLDLQSNNPLAQGLLRDDALALCDLEMRERESSKLPPFTRIATLMGESSAIRTLAKAVSEDEMFVGVSVLSQPNSSNVGRTSNLSKLVLRVGIAKSGEFSQFLGDLARYRSLKGLTPLTIRIDPFTI